MFAVLKVERPAIVNSPSKVTMPASAAKVPLFVQWPSTVIVLPEAPCNSPTVSAIVILPTVESPSKVNLPLTFVSPVV